MPCGIPKKRPRTSSIVQFMFCFLSHLSRRLIGELIVYKGICRPSIVRPSSVRPSTFSNDISSEAEKPILFIFHISHIASIITNNCVFCSGRIRTLVAMATYSSHRLIMGKRGNLQFFLSHWGYLDFFNRNVY